MTEACKNPRKFKKYQNIKTQEGSSRGMLEDWQGDYSVVTRSGNNYVKEAPTFLKTRRTPIREK